MLLDRTMSRGMLFGGLQEKEFLKTKKQPVILSLSNFCGASSDAEAQGVAAAGSRKDSWWLLNRCNICCGKPPKLVTRSLRRCCSSLLPRYSLGKSSTPLRMTGVQIVLLLSLVLHLTNKSTFFYTVGSNFLLTNPEKYGILKYMRF